MGYIIHVFMVEKGMAKKGYGNIFENYIFMGIFLMQRVIYKDTMQHFFGS